MLSWFRNIVGRTKPAAATWLRDRLAAYPPCPPVHVGSNGCLPDSPAPKLTREQLRENFQTYVAAMPERLAILGGLLCERGLDTADAYDSDRRTDFALRLYLLLAEETPAAWRPQLGDLTAWEASDRSGRNVIHSLIGDLAMLCADMLVRAKPGCFLGMNLDPADRQMESYGRPCLLGLSDGLFPGTHNIYYFDGEVFGSFRNMARRTDPIAAPRSIKDGAFTGAILYPVLARLERDVVEPDLPERRAKGWMAKAV